MSTERTDLRSPFSKPRRSFRVSPSIYLFVHTSCIDDYDHDSYSVFLHVKVESELVLVRDSFFLIYFLSCCKKTCLVTFGHVKNRETVKESEEVRVGS